MLMGYTRIELVFLASKARGIATTLISQMVRQPRIGLGYEAWKASILPLNYRRKWSCPDGTRTHVSRSKVGGDCHYTTGLFSWQDSNLCFLLQGEVGLTVLPYRSSILFSLVNPYITCTFYAAGRIRTCVFIAEEEVSNLSPLTIWLLRHTPQTGIEPASPARRSSFQDYRLTIRLLWHLGGVPMVVSPQGQYDSIWVPDEVRRKDLHLQLSLFTKHSVCIHRFLSQRPL